MSKFRSRLSRYNTTSCEQIMPVPVIPLCAVSCCIPQLIYEFKPPPPDIESLPVPAASPPQTILDYHPDMASPPTGTILTNITGTVPSGYLAANGAAISRTTYNQLFLVIGTYYGGADGSTTFNLPNLSLDDDGCVVSYIIKT